jgi:hypothetical protein
MARDNHGIDFKPAYAIAMRLSIDNTAMIRVNLERAEVTRVGKTMAAECGPTLTTARTG